MHALRPSDCTGSSPETTLRSTHRPPRAYPDAETHFNGDTLPEGCGPFVLNPGLTPEADEYAYREEPWSTVLSEVPLTAETVPVRSRSDNSCCSPLSRIRLHLLGGPSAAFAGSHGPRKAT